METGKRRNRQLVVAASPGLAEKTKKWHQYAERITSGSKINSLSILKAEMKYLLHMIHAKADII